MHEKIMKIIIVSIVFIIISIRIDFKIKNFMPEIYYNILIIIFYFFLLVDVKSTNGLIAETYNSFVLLLVPISIMGIYNILKKKKIYYFKGIDKNYIKRNINEISKIVKDYKNNNLDDKSEISLINGRITFEKVSESHISESHIKECLSLIGSYLDENRKKYTVKDYLTYYTKTIAFPIMIVLAIVFILLKIIYNDYDI